MSIKSKPVEGHSCLFKHQGVDLNQTQGTVNGVASGNGSESSFAGRVLLYFREPPVGYTLELRPHLESFENPHNRDHHYRI